MTWWHSSVTEGSVVLHCNVLGGFTSRDSPPHRIPYQGKYSLPEDEYNKSESLKEAVANGWLVLKKNPKRRLNLPFSKKKIQATAPRQLPSPQTTPPTVDREQLKAELLQELLPQLQQTFERSVGVLAQKLEENSSSADLIAKLEENQAKNHAELKAALQNVVVSAPVGQVLNTATGVGEVEEFFIPDQIKADDMKANLDFEQTKGGSVEDAMAALKRLKKEKKS